MLLFIEVLFELDVLLLGIGDGDCLGIRGRGVEVARLEPVGVGVGDGVRFVCGRGQRGHNNVRYESVIIVNNQFE